MSGKIQQELEHYFLPWEQLSQNTKSDGKLYRTYRACLKKEYWPDNEPFYLIIKEIPKSLSTVYDALSHLNNPYLESVHGIIEDDDCFLAFNEYVSPPLYLSDNTIPGMSLSLETFMQDYHYRSYAEKLSPDEKIHQAFVILLQLTDALIALHSAGFIHGDIHPGNILLTDVPDCDPPHPNIHTDFCVKLIDFDNTSIPKESDHTVTRVMGAKPFAAPEILDFTHPLDRADIYSLGCILYYSIYGKSPKEYTPDSLTLQDMWVKRIFRRCTASYEARYHNLYALRKDLLHALKIPSSPIGKALQRIPGFRSRTPWKIAIAAYTYFSMLLYFGISFFSIYKNGLPLQDWQKNNLYALLLFIAEIIVICDAFHLEEHFPKYIYLKNKHSYLSFLIKTILSVCILILFVLLW